MPPRSCDSGSASPASSSWSSARPRGARRLDGRGDRRAALLRVLGARHGGDRAGGTLPRAPIVTGGAQLLAGGALLLAVAGAAGELAPDTWDGASARSLGAAAFLLAFDSLAGFLLSTSLVRSAPLGLVGTYAYVVPLIAVALGVLLLGDEVSAGAALGGAVAMAAVGAQLRARAPTASV